MHPLKATSLLSWAILLAFQLGLLWSSADVDFYWVILLALPLLIPLRGLLCDQRYTYRWIGFMTLVYFCIGISELFANQALRGYGLGTTIASTMLFLTSIYYARYLGLVAARHQAPPESV
jgi:uncharacterized membrane protein